MNGNSEQGTAIGIMPPAAKPSWLSGLKPPAPPTRNLL